MDRHVSTNCNLHSPFFPTFPTQTGGSGLLLSRGATHRWFRSCGVMGSLNAEVTVRVNVISPAPRFSTNAVIQLFYKHCIPCYFTWCSPQNPTPCLVAVVGFVITAPVCPLHQPAFCPATLSSTCFTRLTSSSM